jgi:hypothetical protein
MRGSSTRTATGVALSGTSRSSSLTIVPLTLPQRHGPVSRAVGPSVRVWEALRTTGRSGRGFDPRLAEELLS